MMKFRQNTKRIFTAALVVWMSGIVLFLCCDMPGVKAATVEIESCPLAKKSNCSKTSENNTEHSFRQESHTFDCCAFPAKIFDKVRKTEKLPEAVNVAEAVVTAAPKFSLIEKNFKSPKFYQSFARNRGSTHLQNCVFRI
jgi:hypothetical protein